MFENMSAREKTLALIVGSLVPVFALFYAVFWFMDCYDSNESEIDNLLALVDEQEDKKKRGLAASQRQAYYRLASLPSRNRTRSIYKTWLLDLVEKEAGMKFDAVRYKEGGTLVYERDNVATRSAFTIRPKGTLKQLVTFLHGFYSADHLHRINKLTIKPIARSKRGQTAVLTGDLQMEIEIETLSLADGPENMDSFPRWKQDLAAAETYSQRILNRNIFGPANNPPVLSKPRKLEFTIAKSEAEAQGKYETIQISAKDADADDILAFELLEKNSNNAVALTLGEQPRSASVRKISLRVPKQASPVRIPVTIRVADDGLPAKDDQIDFTVVFKEPKAPKPKKQVPKPKMVAQVALTHVVGLMRGADGRWVARLHTKSERESKELAKGDSLELDGDQWKVIDVTKTMVTFEVKGEEKSFATGSNLAEPVESL